MPRPDHPEQALTVLFIGIIAVLFVVQAKLALQPGNRVTFSIERMNLAFGYASSSSSAVCGNGTKTGSEGCDDGNTTAGDGCSATCTVESGWSCTGTAPSVCSQVCGNGTKTAGEGCDDGGTTNGDGCSSLCLVESGWSCTGTAPSVCGQVCGNGIKTSGEGCDDGNTSNGDGCSSSCTVQTGWSCTGSPSSCSTTCGDGIAAGSEQCDDGNAVNTDGCRNTCVFALCGDSVVQPNGADNLAGTVDDETCDAGGVSTVSCDSNCTAVACGDQFTNTAAGESCDDGNSSNTDACLNSCVSTGCGDGYIRAGVEDCEPPGVGTCSSSCQEVSGVGGSTNLDVAPAVSSTSSSGKRDHCGNGFLEPEKGEKCDLGYLNGISPLCNRSCTNTFCGDGIVQTAGEECEPQRDAAGAFTAPTCGGRMCTIPVCPDDQSCVGGCTWAFLPACLSTSSQPLTRLAIDLETGVAVSSAAAASSAAPVPAASSSSRGNIPSVTALHPPMSLPVFTLGFKPVVVSSAPEPAGVCGNGRREGNEVCDDGPRNSDVLPDSCRTSCTTPACGDGVVDFAEDCDDGNTILGDGCTPLCTRFICGNGTLEQGEECDNGPRNSDALPDSCSTRCLLPRCGDGILDASFAEQCDADGLNSNTDSDSCRLNCLRPRCGDSVRDEGEQCDDGNQSNYDVCSVTCTLIGCGNGVVEWNEECDDGNVLDGDGCSYSCHTDSVSLFQWLWDAIRAPFLF